MVTLVEEQHMQNIFMHDYYYGGGYLCLQVVLN